MMRPAAAAMGASHCARLGWPPVVCSSRRCLLQRCFYQPMPHPLLLQEKEDWINAVGRAIVRHSKSMMDRDQVGG